MARLRWGDHEFVKSFVSMCLTRGSFVPNHALSVFLNRTSCSFLYLGLYDKPACIAIRSLQLKVRKQFTGCTCDRRWHGSGCVHTWTRLQQTSIQRKVWVCVWERKSYDIKKYFWNNTTMEPTFSVIVCKMWAIHLCWGWRTILLWLFPFWWKWENKQ